MKLQELLEGIEVIECTASPELEISGVSADSRQVQPGGLFVAVPGFAADGHKFIPAAVKNGAAAVICEKKPQIDVPYVLTGNARRALAMAAANWYGHPADSMTMIGVTGTNGKTTVTYLLKTVLEKTLGAKVGLIGTIQNMIGDRVLDTERTTPESIELQKLFAEMRDAGCTHVVMEVSSHALALSRVDGVHFRVGVFTNLTEDHLDFHKTMLDYCDAKAKLFQRCDVGVMNLDDLYCDRIRRQASCRILTYSTKDNAADLVAKNIRLKSDRVETDVVTGNEISRAELRIPGAFSVYNALAVIGTGLALGLPLSEVTAALRQAHGVKGRMEVVPTPGKNYTVLIDYSHTPDSLENALKTARGFCKGRVIAVFGCGGDRDPFKRPVMGEIGGRLADLCVVTSDNPRTEDPNAIIAQIAEGMKDAKNKPVVIENRVEAIGWALDHARENDIILLCGKGHETYQEVGHEKRHMDEREIVAEHLEREK